MGQGTKRDIMLQVGGSWAPLTTVWKFVMIKKCTSALQEFLESGLNEVYHNPDWPQQVSGNLTGKYGSRIDLKLSTWQWFVRIQRNIWGKPSKKSHIREMLTLSTCADRRTKITPFWHVLYTHLGTFCTFGFILLTVALERLHAIVRTTWSPVE